MDNLILIMILMSYVFSPLTYYMSMKLREKEIDRRSRGKTRRETFGASIVESFIKKKKSAKATGCYRSLMVHDYFKRKESGELRKLRDIFENTTNKLLKVNISEKDAEEMDLDLEQLSKNIQDLIDVKLNAISEDEEDFDSDEDYDYKPSERMDSTKDSVLLD